MLLRKSKDCGKNYWRIVVDRNLTENQKEMLDRIKHIEELWDKVVESTQRLSDLLDEGSKNV